MQKAAAFWLLAVSFLVGQEVSAQGIFEGGGVEASAVGLGAGVAASSQHGRVLQRTYQSAVDVEQATAVRTQAIQQYMKLGCEFETKKQWGNAEKAFKYVLQVTALRDGPGSPKSVPALQHLATVSKAQNNWGDAISFQKTILIFVKGSQVPNQSAVVNAQSDLADSYVHRQEYVNAEPVLRESLDICDANPSVSSAKRKVVVAKYAKVLRQLNRDQEADALEAKEAMQPAQGIPGVVAGSSQSAGEDINASEKTLAHSPQAMRSPTAGNQAPTVDNVPTPTPNSERH